MASNPNLRHEVIRIYKGEVLGNSKSTTDIDVSESCFIWEESTHWVMITSDLDSTRRLQVRLVSRMKSRFERASNEQYS
jgi:hypothetical protein